MSFTIGTEFDKATQWDKRLAQEIPFLRAWLHSWNAREVLDLACGSGRHSVELAQAGFSMTGMDASDKMLDEARHLAHSAGQPCTFVLGDMRNPAIQSQDAVLCLGNSLCLLPTVNAVRQSLGAMHHLLKPGGGVVLHVLNYERLAQPHHAFFPLKTDYQEGRAIRHFLKMIEVKGSDAWVHLVTIQPNLEGQWLRTVKSDRLTVLSASLLTSEVELAGFGEVQVFGSLRGEGYHAASHDVVLVARKKKTAPVKGRLECDGKPSGTASPSQEGELAGMSGSR